MRAATVGLCLLLAVLTLGVYGSLGHHPFVDYDDQVYVTDNEHVKAGLTWETITWALTSTDQSNWHPLTWISHAMDCELFGLNPAGHHWTSLVLHTINAILLFLLLQRATGATWRSLFVAALFALHPLNVESVAWVAERKNVLSTLFFLLALGAYGWYARKPGAGRYAVLALLFVFGLASKPMVITLPCVLLLLDFWPLRRIKGWTEPSKAFPVEQKPLKVVIAEKLPLLAASAGSAIITIIAQKPSEIPSQALSFSVRLVTSFYAYGAYVWKALVPVHLALIYPHPGRTLGVWKPLLGALLVIAVSAVGWVQRSKRPYLLIGWLWYLGTAVPIIGLMQVGLQVIADRYAYITLIGPFVIVAWLLLPEDERWSSTRNSARLRFVLGGIIIASLSLLTWRQLGFWQSSVDVWTHALKVTSNNSLAEEYLATTLIGLGQYQEGMAHMRAYAAMEPLDPKVHARVAADYLDQGQFPEAAREFEAATRASATLERYGLQGMSSKMLAITYANLGLTYEQMGDPVKAAEYRDGARNTNLQAVGELIQQLDESVAARPTAAGYSRLGMLLQLFGYADDAQKAFAQAQKLDPRVLPNLTLSTGPH